jgi:hypothetical protein
MHADEFVRHALTLVPRVVMLLRLLFIESQGRCELRDAACEDDEVVNIGTKIDCGQFIYCGPFFISCDHGCSHGPNKHGIANSCNSADFMGPLDRQHKKIFDINLKRLRMADYLFGFIESPDAFGTFIEIGLAYAWGIPIALRLPPKSKADMWMLAKAAKRVYAGDAQQCWRQFCFEFLISPARPTIR